MTEHVKQKQTLAINRVPHAWSVTFSNGISPAGVRGDLARNMVAEAAVGNVAVRNDFDRLAIYRRPIFNATWDSTARCWKDFVKQGEEGFTFSPTEENREVVYRCQPFWYKIDFSGEYGPSFVSVTDRPLEGYKLAPMFKNGTTYEYRPCFEMGIGADGKPHSRAGLLPVVGEPVEMMAHARAYDSAAHTEKMADWFSEYLLLLVEFGTRHLSALMPGYTNSSIPLAVCETLSTGPYLGFYASTPDQVKVGEVLRLTYVGSGNTELWCDMTVLDVDTEESSLGYYITTDCEDLYTIMTIGRSHAVHPLPCLTGSALPYLTNASSGTYGDGAHNPCVWRGKENPWGNISSLICDVVLNIADTESATFYELTDLSAFDGTLNDAYTALMDVAKNSIGTGCVKSFARAGKDHMMIPCGVHAGAQTQYWATYTRLTSVFSTLGLRFVRVGGDFATKRPITHGTYEFYGGVNIGLFGARLVLEEG